ncbi:MAG: bacterial Ig-like domain-containing protein [Bacilli bacterium]|nr:bacterial Ig-like domain-containing protein [Bacilli bacterium]
MKKKLSLFIIMLSLLLLVGCFDVAQVKSVTFTKAPEAEYPLGEEVDASQFEVQIVTSNETLTFDLTNANITVQGLVDGMLDTETPGTKSVTVTYQGVSATVYYIVTGTLEVDKWTDELSDDDDAPTLIQEGVYEVATAKQLAYISANSATYATATIKLTANIDLDGKLWASIPTFGGTFDGQGFTISNMTVFIDSVRGSRHGLFAVVTGGEIKNLTIENAIVDTYEYKESAALIGHYYHSADLSINDVTIVNANIKGLSCVGGLIGRTAGGSKLLTISNCYVQGRFSTSNPVLSTFGDGEGDKIGGLVGQHQGTGKATFTGNTVNIIAEGTRDIGGLVGFSSTADYTNNIVLAGTELKANVVGGVRYSVGTRNVGAFVGTVSFSGGNTTFTNNTVASTIVLYVDTVYEPYSSSGMVFGGLRRDSIKAPVASKIVTVNGVDVVVSDNLLYNIDGDQLVLLQEFGTNQETFMLQVAAILAE